MSSVKKVQKRLDFRVRKTRAGKENGLENSPKKLSPRKAEPIDLNWSSPQKRPRLAYNLNQNESPTKNIRSPMSPVKLNENNTLIAHRSPIKLQTNVYEDTRVALSAHSNSRLYCREKEIEEIDGFVKQHLNENRAGSLYISGAPGTGKTACIESILQSVDKKYKRAFVNCANLKDSKSVFQVVWNQLEKNDTGLSGKNYCKALEKKITTSKEALFIVLDEIDFLENKDQSVLYTIFEWPAVENSKLILIGLANALDLTTRVLPRLQSHHSFKCRPTLMHFPPYTKEQISIILQERLKMVCSKEMVIKPAAVEFCARKVASVAGDMRKALDVCRRAVELLEAEMFKERISCSPSKYGNQNVTKTVELPMVVSILNDIYGNSLANRNVESDENALPLQQRILLCTLLLIVKHIKTKEILLGKFGDVFSRVCSKHQASRVDQAEFVSICYLLEARGLLQIKHHKDVRQSKVSLRVNQTEIEFALQDKLLLASILKDSAHLVNNKPQK